VHRKRRGGGIGRGEEEEEEEEEKEKEEESVSSTILREMKDRLWVGIQAPPSRGGERFINDLSRSS